MMIKNKNGSAKVAFLIVLFIIALALVGGYFFLTTPKKIDSARALKNFIEAESEYKIDDSKEGIDVFAGIVNHQVVYSEAITTKTLNEPAVTLTTTTTYKKNGNASNYGMYLISDTGTDEIKAGIYCWKENGKYYQAIGSKTNKPEEMDENTFMLSVGLTLLQYDIVEQYYTDSSKTKLGIRTLGYGLVKDHFENGTMSITKTSITASNEEESILITMDKKITDSSLRIKEIVYTSVSKDASSTVTSVKTYKISYE